MVPKPLNEYITKHYNEWLNYSTSICHKAKSNLDPREALNDALSRILEQNKINLHELLAIRPGHKTRLDYLVMRIIRINIISPRSRIRYTNGQHCTRPMGDDLSKYVTSDLDENSPSIDDQLTLIHNILAELQTSQRNKEIFTWRFFEGKPFTQWPGNTPVRQLRRIYNRIFNEISVIIRTKKN